MHFGYKNGTLLGFRYTNEEGENELRSVIFCKEYDNSDGEHVLRCIDIRDRKRQREEREKFPDMLKQDRYVALTKSFFTSRITTMIVENKTALSGKIKNKHC